MFKKFFVLERYARKYRFIFPNEIHFQNVIEEPFLFPCSDIKNYEHGCFVVVLTEVNGDHNFLISNFIDNGSACVCFQSEHGWFELLYAAMKVVIQSRMYIPNNQAILEEYLKSLTLMPSPMPGLVLYIPGAHPYDVATKVVVPNKIRQKPFSSFISELHSRLKFEDWLTIFESLLFENWIVFHSRHLDRVTSCIFGSLSLVFPFEWVHLIFPCLSEASVNCLGCPSPYIAGVHSCLIQQVIPLLSSGAVIVDIDEGVLSFITSDDSAEDERLPKSLVNFLWRHFNNCDTRLISVRRRGIVDKTEEDDIMMQMVKGFLQVIAFLIGKYNKCKTLDATVDRLCVDNDLLSSSRGDMFQAYIRKLLQSQMVHQFLDDKINETSSEKRSSFNICLGDIDDFEEACYAMERWQPDVYSDTIVSIATQSRRRINLLANKVLDLGKKTEVSVKTAEVKDVTYEALCESASTVRNSKKEIYDEKVKDRGNWIKFDDNVPEKDVENEWVSKEKLPSADLLIFEEMCPPEASTSSNTGRNISGIIRDFDPLFQT